MTSPTQKDQLAITWIMRLNTPNQPPDVHREFFNWLAESPENQVAFLRAEQTWIAAKALKISAPDKQPTPYFRWATLATATACFFLVLIWSMFRGNSSTDVQVYELATKGVKEVRLEDHSSLVLHGPAKIIFTNEHYVRKLELISGEAYFKVAHNAQKPFFVLTNIGAVKVIGTEFTVKNQVNDLLVTVISGQVGVLSKLSASELTASVQPLVTLQKDQQITLSEAQNGQLPKSILAAQESIWREGRIPFDGIPLSIALEQLNQYLPKPIVVPSKHAQTTKIFGVISIVDGQAAAHAVATLLNAKTTEHDDQFVLDVNEKETINHEYKH